MNGKLLLVAVLLLTASGTLAQEFRDTAVPRAQISAVVRDVAQWHDIQNPDCLYVRPVGSTAVEKASDHSVEHWTIEACSNQRFTYEVTVLDTTGGSVTNMVSNVDGSGIAGDESFPEPTAEECADMKRQFDALHADDSEDKDYSQVAQLAADLAVCNALAAP